MAATLFFSTHCLESAALVSMFLLLLFFPYPLCHCPKGDCPPPLCVQELLVPPPHFFLPFPHSPLCTMPFFTPFAHSWRPLSLSLFLFPQSAHSRRFAAPLFFSFGHRPLIRPPTSLLAPRRAPRPPRQGAPLPPCPDASSPPPPRAQHAGGPFGMPPPSCTFLLLLLLPQHLPPLQPSTPSHRRRGSFRPSNGSKPRANDGGRLCTRRRTMLSPPPFSLSYFVSADLPPPLLLHTSMRTTHAHTRTRTHYIAHSLYIYM